MPQQALYLMNSPFVQEQAMRLASRPEVLQHTDATVASSRCTGCRWAADPAWKKRRWGLSFVSGEDIVATAEGKGRGDSPWRYGYGVYDAAAARVTQFEPFAHFTGQRRQGGTTLPDPAIGWAFLRPRRRPSGRRPTFGDPPLGQSRCGRNLHRRAHQACGSTKRWNSMPHRLQSVR